MGSVIFLIPRFDSLMALLFALGTGTAIAAWISLGSKRVAYAGWQIALAFYMTVLQEPHPSTSLDVIWDRWVGIVIGVFAMRVAFQFPATQEFFPNRSAVAGETREL
jgi:multidrug resistance protein MdtO